MRGDTMSETHVQELGHKPLWGNAVLSTSTVNDALEYEPGRPLLALFLRLSIALRELWLRRKRLGFRTGACINHLANEGCFLWTSQDVQRYSGGIERAILLAIASLAAPNSAWDR